jgi:uncharacterized protein with von Willebrand factor type A (vWA) domain
VADGVDRLVAFGRALRAEGLPLGTDRIHAFCGAAAEVPVRDLYWAGRATLLSRRDEIAVYDRVFQGFFGETPSSPRPTPARVAEPVLALASPTELLRQKSFARCSDDELAQIGALMEQLRLEAPLRRSRRRRRAKSGLPDLRRTLRRSFRTGGEPLERAWQERRRVRRRLVFVLDVSGSMADYSRGLLLFAHAALRADRRWEAFCFGTRLTRLTGALATARVDEALRRAAEEAVDRDAGTRIGESLERLVRRHASVVRGSVVVVCSDGLDVGEPELLRTQMARLARLAHAVVWLNPLHEYAGYEPLARGMAAALPYVDVFAAGHNLASLDAAAGELARL